MELNRIHNIPCAEMFAQLPEPAAVIAADPPYNIDYESNWQEKMTSRKNHKEAAPRHKIEFFSDSEIDTSWIKPAFDALKEGGAMYLFTRWDVLHHWHTAALESGFKVPQCIVWNKDMMSMGDLSLYGSQTEFLLFCTKGKHELRWDKREGNIWRFARGQMMANDLPKGGGWRHPTQKPINLFKKIITYSSDMNDLVIDPFTGSGAACIAAQRLHRRFVGCDISPEFAAKAQRWIESDRKTSAKNHTQTKPMIGIHA